MSKAAVEPLISVVMPTYNRSALISAAVQSVLAQHYSNVELIVVDDGSDDDTLEVLDRIHDAQDRIRVIELAHAGAAKARNEGIRQARGDYVAFQDTDDEWDPRFLTTLSGIIAGRTDLVVFCSHSVEHLDGRKEIVPRSWTKNPERALLLRNPISTQTVVAPMAIFLAGYSFDEDLARFQDWELWLRLARSRQASFRHHPEVLATLTRQADSISEGSQKIRSSSLRRILRMHFGLFARHPLALLRLLARIARSG